MGNKYIEKELIKGNPPPKPEEPIDYFKRAVALMEEVALREKMTPEEAQKDEDDMIEATLAVKNPLEEGELSSILAYPLSEENMKKLCEVNKTPLRNIALSNLIEHQSCVFQMILKGDSKESGFGKLSEETLNKLLENNKKISDSEKEEIRDYYYTIKTVTNL